LYFKKGGVLCRPFCLPDCAPAGCDNDNSYGIVDGSVRGRPRLRSFKPVSNKVADPVYKVPQVEHVIPGGEKPFTEEMMSDKLKTGLYLVTVAHCMECHTPLEKGVRQWDTRVGTGGFEFPGP
jgi:hypothetical protein